MPTRTRGICASTPTARASYCSTSASRRSCRETSAPPCGSSRARCCSASANGSARRSCGSASRRAAAREESLQAIAELLSDAALELRAKGRLEPETLATLREELPERIRRDPIVRMPHHLVLVGRALGLLSGQLTSLGADVDLMQIFAPLAAQGPR